MKLLLITVLAATATAFVDHTEWESFKFTHGKTYANAIEEFYRMQVYADNKAFVSRHNAQHAQGKHTFTVALNRFADLTTDEVNSRYHGYMAQSSRAHDTHQLTGRAAPEAVDWRDQGIVTPIKDQGQCGSCWAFSSTGSLEAAWALAGHELASLSEQQLVDCSGQYGNDGCDGGLMDQAFRYLEAEGGIQPEADYPYMAEDGTCRADVSRFVVAMARHVDVMAAGSEEVLQDAVASVGPISVAIDASQRSFHFYSGGVYSEPECNTIWLDHAVLVVGYGSENDADFWLVKNSWGTSWGEEGYIKMTRDDSNQCGIASEAVYPVV